VGAPRRHVVAMDPVLSLVADRRRFVDHTPLNTLARPVCLLTEADAGEIVVRTHLKHSRCQVAVSQG